MSTTAPDQSIDQRVADLEQKMLRVEHQMSWCSRRLLRLEAASVGGRGRLAPSPALEELVVLTPPRPEPEPPFIVSDERSDRARRDAASIGDLVGGRWLAWIGGVATLLGIVLFLALAISSGWIDPAARVILAGLGAAVLVAGGAWLHRHRGRTEAALVMVGTGTAGLFATLLVATSTYDLVSPELGLLGAMTAGAGATVLAIRWAGPPIAAIGLVGALASPLMVGAPVDGTTIVVLLLATACSMSAVVWQRWTWLAVVAPLIGAPQWAYWLSGDHSTALELAIIGAFFALGLAGAVGAQLRSSKTALNPASAVLFVFNACIVAVVGYIAFERLDTPTTAALWLVALALAHGGLGLIRRRHFDLPRHTRKLLIALAVILADVAFGLNAGGLLLVAGWGAAAIGFAWLHRHHSRDETDEALVGLGLGAHIGLVLLRTFLAAPPDQLQAGSFDAVGLVTIAALAATCILSARMIGANRKTVRTVLDAFGLAAIAYLTADTFHGPALAVAWTVEAAALGELHRQSKDQLSAIAATGFGLGAFARALIFQAPPSALLSGPPSIGAAAIAVGAISLALARAGHNSRAHTLEEARARKPLLAAAAVTALYLASIALIGAFQPGAGMPQYGALDLSVQQQGQVLLSALWSVVGLATLLVGLRRRMPAVRLGGLALLLATAAKVFAYDLSTLTSIYRVVSFIVLGLLLLSGAFAYQRLRPVGAAS